jgi:hypothetical protein
MILLIIQTTVMFFSRYPINLINPINLTTLRNLSSSFVNLRSNQTALREYLIKHKKHECILCDKKMPLDLLHAAHLKPYPLITNRERVNRHVVEFMCLYCHKLYDKGFLGVNKGILEQSKALDLSKLDIIYENHKVIDSYNSINHVFFDYHYEFIYKHNHNHKH